MVDACGNSDSGDCLDIRCDMVCYKYSALLQFENANCNCLKLPHDANNMLFHAVKSFHLTLA